jgi:hypothetical protein
LAPCAPSLFPEPRGQTKRWRRTCLADDGTYVRNNTAMTGERGLVLPVGGLKRKWLLLIFRARTGGVGQQALGVSGPKSIIDARRFRLGLRLFQAKSRERRDDQERAFAKRRSAPLRRSARS